MMDTYSNSSGYPLDIVKNDPIDTWLNEILIWPYFQEEFNLYKLYSII